MNVFVRSLPATASLALVLAACGSSGASDRCDAPCITPPPATCNGGTPARFELLGECIDGACRYEPLAASPCEGGCLDGACVPPALPCEGDACDAPPADTCEAAVAVRFADVGACNEATDTCEYAPVRTDCAARGARCLDGACVPLPCTGVTCDAPPEATCDGNYAVGYADTGTCDAATGECAYEETRADCAAAAQRCENGRCAEPPECDDATDCPPAATPACDGSQLVTTRDAVCDRGRCAYETVRRACTLEGLVCEDGACVEPPPDLCAGVVCDAPPLRYCEGSVSVRFPSRGRCDEGECGYAETREDCTERGRACLGGDCVVDPCAGVDCSEPPIGRCEGTVAVSGVAPGACLSGRCEFAEQRRNCASEGLRCEAGACVDPCASVGECVVPPASYCEETTAVVLQAPGVCVDGECVWTEFRQPCGGDTACIDGGCRDACWQVTCDTPPEAVCSGTVAVSHDPLGTCNLPDATCTYRPVSQNCALEGLVCIDGACVPDPCETAVCDDPGAARCEDDVLREPYAPGLCIDTACQYAERSEDCTDTDRRCLDGGCRDACWEVECPAPPPRCEGDVVFAAAGAGTCQLEDLSCAFEWVTTNCGELGLPCRDGACWRDPCTDVVCDTPPPGTCEGDLAVVPRTGGVCVDGTCEWELSSIDCAAGGQRCRDGACVERCAGVVCDDVPDPTCEADTRVSYSGGLCDPARGECVYAATPTDCTASGRVCVGGACVADPCDAVTCDDPPGPRCEGDYLASPVAAGTCDRGACSYDEVLTNCAAVEFGRCIGGACVVVDPCAGVVCPPPSANFCESRETLINFLPGTCDQGVCRYSEVRVNCAASGLWCNHGQCEEVPDCGSGADCETPDNYCEGSVAWRPVYERCDFGRCVFDFVPEDCFESDRTCEGGTCVLREDCGPRGCDAPWGPVCFGDTLATFLAPGICLGDGICDYRDYDEFDCRLTGDICVVNRCVDDPCDVTICDEPPEAVCSTGEAYPLDYLIDYEPIGECDRGICSYAEVARNCGPDGFCEEGICRSGGRCDDVDCADQVPFCFDDQFLISPELGSCDPLTGRCSGSRTETDCFASGRTCVEGACVSPVGIGRQQVVVSELMTQPSGSGPWFEVRNLSSAALNLQGVTVTEIFTGRAFQITSSTPLPPYGLAVIGAGSAASAGVPVNFVWPVASGFALPSSIGELRLTNSNGLVSAFGWDAEWPLSPAAAFGLDPRTVESAKARDRVGWCAQTTRFDGTNRGTPGAVNDTCPDD